MERNAVIETENIHCDLGKFICEQLRKYKHAVGTLRRKNVGPLTKYALCKCGLFMGTKITFEILPDS